MQTPRGFRTIRISSIIAALAITPIAFAAAHLEPRPPEPAPIDIGSLGRHHAALPESGWMAVMAVALLALHAATHLRRGRRAPGS